MAIWHPIVDPASGLFLYTHYSGSISSRSIFTQILVAHKTIFEIGLAASKSAGRARARADTKNNKMWQQLNRDLMHW